MAATTSPQDQVKTNLEDNHIKISAKQKKDNEFVFKKYFCKQVETPTKVGWYSTGNLPWKKDSDLVTKVYKDLKISINQAAEW